MPRFVIERDVPGTGKLSQQDLHAIAPKSCGVLSRRGPQIRWMQSYATEDKICCVYVAPAQEAVREHARQGGFPASRVSREMSVIDPSSVE